MEKQADLWLPMHARISIIPAADVSLPSDADAGTPTTRTTSACMLMTSPA